MYANSLKVSGILNEFRLIVIHIVCYRLSDKQHRFWLIYC